MTVARTAAVAFGMWQGGSPKTPPTLWRYAGIARNDGSTAVWPTGRWKAAASAAVGSRPDRLRAESTHTRGTKTNKKHAEIPEAGTTILLSYVPGTWYLLWATYRLSGAITGTRSFTEYDTLCWRQPESETARTAPGNSDHDVSLPALGKHSQQTSGGLAAYSPHISHATGRAYSSSAQTPTSRT